MNTNAAIQLNLDMASFLTKGYLGDLEDSELLVRPVPGANHIAWQLGHLIASENSMVNEAFPGSMPELPAGFAAKYTNETSKLDSPSAFHVKQHYLELMQQQRTATLAKLASLSPEEFDKPVPAKYAGFLKNIGDLFSLMGSHWVMHAGQWAVIRRKLGRKPMF